MVPAPPRTTQDNIEDVYGEMGRLWLTLLPETLERVCDAWSLTIDAFLGGNYAVVYLVRDADNHLMVLKLGVPSREVEREWRTLQAFGGNGCVRLRELDQAGTALLLDRVAPGRCARELPDDEAMDVAADLFRSLHSAEPDLVLPDVTELTAGFERLRQAHGGGAGPIDEGLLRAAESSFEAVLPERPRVLLHGDLHHGNILSKGEGWTSIDPHGVRGPAEWEAGALLRNPWKNLRTEALLNKRLDRRVDRLCECMEWDAQIVRRLAAAQAVLSAVWSWEDHGLADPLALRVAAALWR
jgi:streptomycin 6-kinase